MKGTNDAWNVCMIKCIANACLIGIILIKGDNSPVIKQIIINTTTTECILMKITMCLNKSIQAAFIGYSRILKGEPMYTSYKPEVCIIQAS